MMSSAPPATHGVDSRNLFASDVKVHRTGSLYFPDGDIVLATEGTLFTGEKIARLYRVDKIFLARYSKVFADMFKLPPVSPDACEVYDGAPLVRLVGDDAGGVQDVLRFIYNPGCVLLLVYRALFIDHAPLSSHR